MKILLTGAFGNIGRSTLPQLLKQGHRLTCFELKTRATHKTASKFAGQIQIIWGDIRQPQLVKEAVQGQEIVIHLAAIIPPLSDARPDLARAVNIGGTGNLIAALQATPQPARLIQASSLALFGPTQHQPPPRTLDDPIRPTDPYTHHKAACETMVKASGLAWTILRFAAVLPLAIVGQIDPLMFEVPLTDRIEFLHPADAGLAIARAVQSEAVWGKTWLIGGGPRCQLYQHQLIEKNLEAIGIGMLPPEAFGTRPYHTDWLDTTESQRLLDYQRHTFEDYLQDIITALGYRRYLFRLLRPLIRRLILRGSPYWRNHKALP